MNAGPDQTRDGGPDISPETVATTPTPAAEAAGVPVSGAREAAEPDAVDRATEALDPELVQAGRSLLLGPVSFVMGAAGLRDLPPDDLPEIAFAGRSNVGKSSLINALTERGNLARVSNTPGRTQQLNFFRFADRLMMVDMPGYGYAEAPKAMVKAWQKMVFSYLRGRSNLARVYVLIDGRHGVKENDREVFKLLDDAAVSYQVVVTKADKEKAPVLEKRLQAIEAELRRHVAAYPEVIVTSSRKMRGMETLRAAIARLLLENNQGG
ncbi:ribosome biogenesis GTP-binding protein YihA/YsxC [Tistrella mobilis]|uniref:ribosome biogenesis GTP-binding protein YihA/YsxC n=1 Tax=Tistrella mobilis TaxID=171437 RepID=UPI0035573DCA